MKIGSRDFEIGKQTYIMGILNVTPDSFSDGGKFQGVDHALARAETLIADGADILDIGGESTRPGYTKISDDEEISRVVPVIEAIRKRFDIPLSIDTYKSAVAEAAIAAGGDLVNDIWGLKYDTHMAAAAKRLDVPVCVMHNRQEPVYTDFMPDVLHDLQESIRIAEQAGISRDKLILDPGVGFAKSYEQNLEVIARLEAFRAFGLPLLLGTSRKSVIGLTLKLPVTEREEGTIATSVIGVMAGCDFIRVHDVKRNFRAIRMAEAIRTYRAGV
jgi:dihydropteroate synthase